MGIIKTRIQRCPQRSKVITTIMASIPVVSRRLPLPPSTWTPVRTPKLPLTSHSLKKSLTRPIKRNLKLSLKSNVFRSLRRRSVKLSSTR